MVLIVDEGNVAGSDVRETDETVLMVPPIFDEAFSGLRGLISLAPRTSVGCYEGVRSAEDDSVPLPLTINNDVHFVGVPGVGEPREGGSGLELAAEFVNALKRGGCGCGVDACDPGVERNTIRHAQPTVALADEFWAREAAPQVVATFNAVDARDRKMRQVFEFR